MIPKITGDEFIKACESNDLETVTMHLHEHADYVNANGDSGLSWAAVRGNLEIVNLLMSASHLNINLVSKNLTSPLTLAASMGHTDIVKQLMTCKTLNVNHVDQHGYSALLWAFQKNNEEMVKALLYAPKYKVTNDIDINVISRSGDSPLIWCAANGNYALLTMLLLRSDLNVNVKHLHTGANALIIACKNGNAKFAETLLARPDLSVNEINNDGDTALIWACAKGLDSVVRLLLDRRDINILHKSRTGFDAFGTAKQHQSCLDMLSAFQNQTFPVNVENKSSMTVQKFLDFGKDGNLEMIKAYLREGQDINAVNSNGDTCLIWAALKGQKECVRYLVARPECNVNHISKNGSTALLLAASAKMDESVMLLLTRPDIDPNQQSSKNQYNGLIWAGQTNSVACVRYFLYKPTTDINRFNKTHDTVLIWAISNLNLEMFDLLLTRPDIDVNIKSGQDSTPLVFACKKGNGEMAMRLLNDYSDTPGFDINSQNKDGDTALVWAAVKNLKDVILKLLTYPHINVKHVTKNGNTALTVARLDDTGREIKKILTEFLGEDLNDEDLTSAWIDAAKTGKLDELVKMTSKNRNFNLNRINSNGDTALIWAALKGHDSIVDWLLSQPSIDVNVVSKNGSTALLLAASAGNASICSKLCSKPEISRTINQQSNTKYTALIWACQTACETAVEAILSVPGVQINLVNEKNDPAFIWGVSKGNINICRMFLERDELDINLKSGAGSTPFCLACKQGNAEIAKLIMHYRSNDIHYNEQNKDGDTALIWASCKNLPDVVDILLTKPGINIKHVSNNGNTAITVARLDDTGKRIKKRLEDTQLQKEQSMNASLVAPPPPSSSFFNSFSTPPPPPSSSFSNSFSTPPPPPLSSFSNSFSTPPPPPLEMTAPSFQMNSFNVQSTNVAPSAPISPVQDNTKSITVHPVFKFLKNDCKVAEKYAQEYVNALAEEGFDNMYALKYLKDREQLAPYISRKVNYKIVSTKLAIYRLIYPFTKEELEDLNMDQFFSEVLNVSEDLIEEYKNIFIDELGTEDPSLLFDENVPLDYSDVAEILDGKIKRGHLVAIEYLMNNFGKDDLLGEDNDEVNFNDSLTVTSGISEGFSTISSSFSIDDQTKSESTTSQNTYCKNRFSDIPFGPYYFIQNIANAIHSSQFSFVCDGYYNGPRQTDVKIKISTHALEDLIKEEEIYTLMKETNLGDNFAECYGLIRNQVHEKIMDGRECSGLILERGIRDLRSYLNPKTWNYFIKNHPDVIRQYTREILTCINALHTAGFCWLDVKPENFVYFRSVVLGMEHYKWKAIDLDSCLVIGTPLSHKVTPRYCPPEVAKAIIEGQISNLKASPTFDSWSAGILILEILDGHHYLNEIEDENEILNVLAGENFVRDLHAHIDARHSHSSSALAERLKALLQEDPKSRELVSGTLKHSFFTGTQATLLVDYKKLTEGVERIESKINDLSNVSSEVQDSIEYLKADIFEEHTTDLKEIVDTLLNNQSAITQVSTKVNNEVSNVLNSDSVVLTKDLVERIVKETTNNIEDIFRARNSPIMEEILLKLDDQKNVFQKMATNEKSTSEDFKQILHCLQDSVDSISSGMSSVTSDLKIITGNTFEILSKVREHSKPLLESNAEFKKQDIPSLIAISSSSNGDHFNTTQYNLKCICPSCFSVPLEEGVNISLSYNWKKEIGILVKITCTLLKIAQTKAMELGIPPPAICKVMEEIDLSLATDLGLQGKLIEIVFNQPDVMNKTLSEVLPEWKNLSLSFTLVIKTSDTVQDAFEKLLNNAYFNLSTLLRYVDIGVDRFGLERIDNTNCRENPGMVCKSCAEIYRTQSNVDESNLKINSKSALVPQFKQGDEDFEEGASVVEHKTKTTLGGSPSKTSTNTRRSVSGGGVLVENVSSHSVYSAPKKRGKKLKKTVAL